MRDRALRPSTQPASVAQQRQQLLPNGVLGMLIFVITEAMLFAGMISGFLIIKAHAAEWPPLGQPRLPVGETAFNTAALLASGIALILANRAFNVWPNRARTPLLASLALGTFFVVFQGFEWLALIREGLTLTSSTHGAFFYLIVGTHALHAVAALIALAYSGWLLSQRRLRAGTLQAVSLFWYFVVGIWPILYFQVYLS
jgi:cytochrome c oxidase subunit 3